MMTIRIEIAPDLLRSDSDEITIRINKDGVVCGSAQAAPNAPQLSAYMQEVIDELARRGRTSTAKNYMSTRNSFLKFRKGIDLPLGEIDRNLMKQYENYLYEHGIQKNTISFYMRILRAVYNKAVSKYSLPDTGPFRLVYTGISPTYKRALPLSTIKDIKNLHATSPSMLLAKDMFLFSFYTRGMSLVDMAYLKKSDIHGDTLTYRRKKTGRRLFIKWEPCMQQIVDRHPSANDTYLLPLIHRPGSTAREQYKQSQFRINRQLRLISISLGLARPLTMYVARHSWASIAKEMDIPLGTISAAMGHSSLKTTQIYLKQTDNKMIDMANSQIIESL